MPDWLFSWHSGIYLLQPRPSVFLIPCPLSKKNLQWVPSKEKNPGLLAANQCTTNWATLHPTELSCTLWAMLHPHWAMLHPIWATYTKKILCWNAGLSSIRSCTGMKKNADARTSPVPECSGTELRWGMPECRCPAMPNKSMIVYMMGSKRKK